MPFSPEWPEKSGYFCFMMLKEITLLTAADLENIRHYAELRYSIIEIASMLLVDVGQLRMAMQNPRSDVALAYNSGKLLSSVKRREKIFELAELGEEWAIKQMDRYEAEQKEADLMP